MGKSRFVFSVWVWVVCLIGSCTSTNSRNIPVADFFTSVEKSNFKISPDGRYVSYLEVSENRQRKIFLIDTQSDNPTGELASGDIHDVGSYYWVAEDELIYTERIPADDSLRIFAMQLGVAPRLLMPASDLKVRFIQPVTSVDRNVLISLNVRDSNKFDVFRLPLDGSPRKLVAENPGNIIRWYADPKGELRMALASDSIQETVMYRRSEKEPFKPVLENIFHTSVVPLGFVQHKDDHIFALSNVNRDKLNLVELNMETGAESAMLYQRDDVDLSAGGYDLKSGSMRYAFYFDDRRVRHFFDKDYERVYQKLMAHLPDYEIRVLDEDFTDKKLIVHAFKDVDPGALYYFDGDSDKLLLLTEINPKLKNASLSPMSSITYEARDGQLLHGYLTLPASGSKRGLPVIVYPHGGPNDRNVWGYNPEVQFFASRGYAVFQVNYRGSDGYGKAFWTAGFKEWGGLIQDDITDGVQWLIDQKIADPQRIGIFGMGFGGYSAIHGACFNSGLYAAAASYGGFTNLFTHLKEIPPHLKPYLQKYYEIIGNPETESGLIRSMSPVFHADKIEIPVFVAQGGKDSRSSVPEISQFIQKIRKRNIPVTLMLREDEGRYFRKEENRITFYEELGKFFDSHVKKR